MDPHKTEQNATDSAIPTHEPANAPPVRSSRRRLLNWLWTILLAAVSIETLWIIVSFFRPRKTESTADNRLFVAGPIERFAADSVTAFPAGRFYLARLADGGFLALDRTCTHLGCTVPWNAETRRFECPCHASTFDIAGEVLGPPAPRPLDTYPVRIENGIVKVDLTQRTRRTEFASAQEAHP